MYKKYLLVFFSLLFCDAIFLFAVEQTIVTPFSPLFPENTSISAQQTPVQPGHLPDSTQPITQKKDKEQATRTTSKPLNPVPGTSDEPNSSSSTQQSASSPKPPRRNPCHTIIIIDDNDVIRGKHIGKKEEGILFSPEKGHISTFINQNPNMQSLQVIGFSTGEDAIQALTGKSASQLWNPDIKGSWEWEGEDKRLSGGIIFMDFNLEKNGNKAANGNENITKIRSLFSKIFQPIIIAHSDTPQNNQDMSEPRACTTIKNTLIQKWIVQVKSWINKKQEGANLIRIKDGTLSDQNHFNSILMNAIEQCQQKWNLEEEKSSSKQKSDDSSIQKSDDSSK